MAVVPRRCTIVSMDRVTARHTHCVFAAPASYSKRVRVVVSAGAARQEPEHLDESDSDFDLVVSKQEHRFAESVDLDYQNLVDPNVTGEGDPQVVQQSAFPQIRPVDEDFDVHTQNQPAHATRWHLNRRTREHGSVRAGQRRPARFRCPPWIQVRQSMCYGEHYLTSLFASGAPLLEPEYYGNRLY